VWSATTLGSAPPRPAGSTTSDVLSRHFTHRQTDRHHINHVISSMSCRVITHSHTDMYFIYFLFFILLLCLPLVNKADHSTITALSCQHSTDQRQCPPPSILESLFSVSKTVCSVGTVLSYS